MPAGKMCLICYSSAKPLNELSNNGNNMNCQITAFFLIRKLFELSNFTCTNLLKDHGNPSSWFVCCSECFTTVRNAQVVFNQLMRIKHKWKTLKSTLEDQLLDSYNQEKGKTNSNGSDCLIREEICKRLQDEIQESKTANELPKQGKSNSEQFDKIKNELKEENQEYEDHTDDSTLFHMEDILSYNKSEASEGITSNFCNSTPKGKSSKTLNVINEPTSYLTRNGRLTKKPKYVSEDNLRADCISQTDKADNVDLNSSIQNVRTTISCVSLTKLRDKYKCKIFRSKTSLKRQRIRKKSTRKIKSDSIYLWPCFVCRKRFKFKSSLTRHRHKKNHFPNDAQEKSSPKHSVEFDKSLPVNENPTSDGIVKSHTPITPGRGVYSCLFCPKQFTYMSSLTRHRKNIHFPNDPEEKSSPNRCYKIDESHLENENQTTAGIIVSIETLDDWLYPCLLCGKSFKCKSSWTRHRKQVHFPNDPEEKSSPKFKYYVEVDTFLPDNETRTSDFHCRGCEKTFGGRIQRYEHENSLHGMKNQFVCISCKDCFTTEAGVNVHFNQIHSSEGIRDKQSNSKQFSCEHCGNMFKCFAKLKTHTEVVHENLRNFVCETCSQSFTQLKYLKFHQVREHNVTFDDLNVNALKCEHCGKMLASPSALRIHIKGVHEKKHPFYCSVCNVGRFSQSAINKHMLISHTKEKPEKCTMCTRSFINKKSLDEHMNMHNNERPYKCKYCDTCLFTKKSLLRHEEIHKGELYYCEFCEKTFPTKHYLRNHRRYAHKVQIRKSTTTEAQKSVEQNQV